MYLAHQPQNTQPLIHLFCSKIKIAGLHYNQLTQITSIFGDPSSDSRLIRSNWISTNITTLASSISKIAHIIATKSLIDPPTSIQTDTVIVVFISSRAVTPINSNIISCPFLSTYFLFSGYKILYISSLCLIRLVRNSLDSMASSSQLSAQPAYTTLNHFTPAQLFCTNL